MTERRCAARWWVAALVAATCATLPWTVQPYWDAKPDAASYLMAAQSLLRGDGYRVMGEPFTVRPPGFSVLLLPIVAWRGLDFTALNAFVSATGVAAVVLVFLLFRARVGAPIAFVLALVVWLAPGFQQLCNQVLSDVPGLALALLALLALRWADRSPTAGRDVAVGVAIALAAYVRAANLLLLPALVLDRACRGLRGGSFRRADLPRLARRALVPVLVAGALYAPWALREAVPSAYGDEALRSYTTALLRADPNRPDAPAVGAMELLERVGRNARRYAGAIAVDPATGRPTASAWLVVAALLCGWAVVLFRRRAAPEWFAALGVAVILLYYVAQPRLALAPAVLLLGGAAEAARLALARRAPRRAADGGVIALLALLAWSTFTPDFMRERSRERHLELLAVRDQVRASTPLDVPLGGDLGAVYALVLDRPVYRMLFLCNQRGVGAAREAVVRWRLARIIVLRDGPCAPLIADGVEEGAFEEFAVVRLARD